MNIISTLRKDKILGIALIAWFIVVIISFRQIPHEYFSHDYGAHLEYTKIISQQHRLPTPNEGWETHQQPLFYLIASLLRSDLIDTDLKTHSYYVKTVSAICGAVALIAISFLLTEISSNSIFRLLVLLFMATTPKFIFLFTTYNNDSMATMFSILVIVISYFFHKHETKNLRLILFISALAGLYTKLTVLMPVLIMILLCSRNFVLKKQPVTTAERKIIITLIASIMLMLPWSFFHSYQSTGKFFPSFSFNSVPDGLQIQKDKLLSVTLPTSILENEGSKWIEPWVHPWPNPASKRNDYWSYVFITSVIGEFIFRAPEVLIVWLILFIHLFAYFIAVKYAFKSGIGKLALLVAFLAQLGHLSWIYKTPYSCNMDYRYISWSYVSWAALFLNAMTNNDKLIKWFYKALITGIVLQVYFLLNVVG